jgi:hypothetical protein
MPHPVDPAAHDTHDALLVAAFAAGDATGRDQVTASTLVATCPDCAALHRDLRAIAAALPELPAPARPRDFRITAQQAASLRPAGWRGLLATLAGPRFSFAMPLGSGLAALGLVGILVGSLAGVPLGAGGAASATSAPAAGGMLEAPMATTPSMAPSAGAGAGGVDDSAAQPEDVAAATDADLQAESWTKQANDRAATTDSERDVLLATGLPAGALAALAGGLVLLAGLTLLVARLVARRLA